MNTQANTFQWCPDVCDAVGQDLYSDQLHNATETQCIVPVEKIDTVHHSITAENTQVFPNIFVGVREINSQERETALSRYKEKKKSRRYCVLVWQIFFLNIIYRNLIRVPFFFFFFVVV